MLNAFRYIYISQINSIFNTSYTFVVSLIRKHLNDSFRLPGYVTKRNYVFRDSKVISERVRERPEIHVTLL